MKKLIPLVIAALIGFLLIKGWLGVQLSPVSNQKETKVFVISKGEGFSSVTDRLKKENLIRASLAFSLLGKQSGLAGQIKAGTFKISPSYKAEEILKIITDNPIDNWVTLLEGWRIEEMADKLSEQDLVEREQFIKVAKEGYIFPDTYLFPKDYSAKQIAEVTMDNFEKKYTPELRFKIKALGLTDDEGVILASIVEREARSDQARTMAASILLKRLKIGMGLNADATIQYALGYQPQEKSWWKRHLSKEDLKIDSPYSTYLYQGLPPAPISNPGLASLKAVANADSSVPYLYYYHDSKGNSHYAKTLEEHNQNVASNP